MNTTPSGYLTFAHPNIGFICDGLEDATIRVALERDFHQGQLIELQSPNETVFALARVEDIYETDVGKAYNDCVFADNRSHPADSTSDLQQRLNQHYPDTTITYDTEVTVIYFDVVCFGWNCSPSD